MIYYNQGSKNYGVMESMAIEEYLKNELGLGSKFIAFEGDAIPEMFLCHFFLSSYEAERFCSASAWRQDREDGSYHETHYHYYAIENILREYDLANGKTSSMKPEPEIIAALLKEQVWDVSNPESLEQSCIQLAYGLIVPVQRSISLVPEEVIDTYHIVEHQHRYVGGLIYELGHNAQVRLSFAGKQKAYDAFDKLATATPHSSERSMTELLLIGSFKGTRLQLDDEGTPLFNSGLILANAGRAHNETRMSIVCDPGRALSFQQQFFTRMDETATRLVQLDDRLEELASLGNLQSYYAGYGFRSVMNERILQSSSLQKLENMQRQRENHPNKKGNKRL